MRLRGFTLFETLVALAVLAVVLTAAFRAVAMATGNAEALQVRLLADWVAQDRLALHRALADWPGLGVYEGQAEQGSRAFHWREEVRSTANAQFRRIDVSVREAEAASVLATRTGFVVRDQ